MVSGAGLLALTGCEDALDRFPEDRLTPDTFFKTGTECELFTNDFYTMLPGA